MDDSKNTCRKMPIIIRDIKAARRDAFLDGLDELLR